MKIVIRKNIDNKYVVDLIIKGKC